MIAAIPAPPDFVVRAVVGLLGMAIGFGISRLLRRILPPMAFRVLGIVALSLVVMAILWVAIAHSAERTLTFTLPLTTAKANASGQIVDCSGGAPIKQLAGWRLYAQIQSPTYVARGRAMLDNADEWARWWPVCAAEALPRQVRSASSKHLPNGGAGQRVTVSAPDSLDGMPVLVYFVTTFNDSLEVSCTSNLRAGR